MGRTLDLLDLLRNSHNSQCDYQIFFFSCKSSLFIYFMYFGYKFFHFLFFLFIIFIIFWGSQRGGG